MKKNILQINDEAAFLYISPAIFTSYMGLKSKNQLYVFESHCLFSTDLLFVPCDWLIFSSMTSLWLVSVFDTRCFCKSAG